MNTKLSQKKESKKENSILRIGNLMPTVMFANKSMSISIVETLHSSFNKGIFQHWYGEGLITKHIAISALSGLNFCGIITSSATTSMRGIPCVICFHRHKSALKSFFTEKLRHLPDELAIGKYIISLDKSRLEIEVDKPAMRDEIIKGLVYQYSQRLM